ncbi:hypothetical protein BuS5_03974 (plasmid) [Desulfosarcina sp. BuS5]|uniref:hypothetical protein n=1 Tax=Desulfosarcina sp. BuS5 TaxID=933262 RepID=UPI0023799A84|nr:hypothetical protein [Desulfosarcina sp. BuS5]WDN87897.1 hypothetical protein BuS5_00865 [Desulfosarcina sp. BuS5]WDN91002.1 hypothetical protein BuS5_03974 [Desulfosarcina sp. BuS5]
MIQQIKEKIIKLKTKLSKIFSDPDKSRKFGLGIVAAGATLLIAGTAAAFIPVPAAGSFAFDVYDVAVNQLLNGPIGFTAGVGAMVFGGAMAIQQKISLAIPCILGGALIMTADTMTQTLGAIF